MPVVTLGSPKRKAIPQHRSKRPSLAMSQEPSFVDMKMSGAYMIRAVKVFEQLDTDHNGEVDATELLNFCLSRAGIDMTMDEAEAILATCDQVCLCPQPRKSIPSALAGAFV